MSEPLTENQDDDQSVQFRLKLEKAINQCSMENGSDTPDFILAKYLLDCLRAFDYAVQLRSEWFRSGRKP